MAMIDTSRPDVPPGVRPPVRTAKADAVIQLLPISREREHFLQRC